MYAMGKKQIELKVNGRKGTWNELKKNAYTVIKASSVLQQAATANNDLCIHLTKAIAYDRRSCSFFLTHSNLVAHTLVLSLSLSGLQLHCTQMNVLRLHVRND